LWIKATKPKAAAVPAKYARGLTAFLKFHDLRGLLPIGGLYRSSAVGTLMAIFPPYNFELYRPFIKVLIAIVEIYNSDILQIANISLSIV
jgi:hypothetical protein